MRMPFSRSGRGFPINIRNTNDPRAKGTMMVENCLRPFQIYDYRHCERKALPPYTLIKI